jgi:hypothetical protein
VSAAVAIADAFGLGRKIPVCSITRLKSASVFSLMIDGWDVVACRIVGRSRPVKIVIKRGAIGALERSLRRVANRPIRWARNWVQILLIADVDKSDAHKGG